MLTEKVIQVVRQANSYSKVNQVFRISLLHLYLILKTYNSNYLSIMFLSSTNVVIWIPVTDLKRNQRNK